MTPRQIIGWKNYAVATMCFLVGSWCFAKGDLDGGFKGVLAAFALISLRDVLAKVLTSVDSNCQKLDDLRAAIEAELGRGNKRKVP